MNVTQLTEALLADREQLDRSDHNIVACRSCGYTFCYKGRRGDLNGSFCSTHCQNWYDAGNAPIEHDHAEKAYKTPIDRWRVVAAPPGVGVRYCASVFPRGYRFTSMTMSAQGYRIRCASCCREFESRGLRCCSPECERGYRERQENLAAMAEVGIAPAPRRECASCGARIPTWRQGRKVSSSARFCSPKCQQRARRQSNPKKAVLNGETAKKAA
jgi:hypothetical protein